MEAVMNGLAAYGTIIPFGGTFFNFVSYGAGAVRLAALSKFRTITVATHDSIGLGEDGPTHQPIETIAHFRATPNLMVWRPADGNECSAAYYVAISSKETPSILCLSRQNLPQLEGSTIEHALKGGYCLVDIEGAQVTLASSGSEVSICVDAVSELKKQGIKARVVSLPCWETFMEQPMEYRLSVLTDGHPILYVEPFSTFGTEKMAHESFGINTWGTSTPPYIQGVCG
jgi:transketolase